MNMLLLHPYNNEFVNLLSNLSMHVRNIIQQTDRWCHLILCGWCSHHEVPLQGNRNGHCSKQEILVCTSTSSQGISHVLFVYSHDVSITVQVYACGYVYITVYSKFQVSLIPGLLANFKLVD